MAEAARAAAAAPRVPYAVAARGLLRDSVLDALDGLIRTRGWSATTMADVARAAGVSRQTLYNEFGPRAALVGAYLTREVDSLVAAAAVAVRAHADDAHTALREAFALFLRLASDEPVVQLIVTSGAGGSDGDEPLRLLTAVGRDVAGGQIAELIVSVWPQVGPDDAAMVADVLVRLAISHALLPAGDPAEVARGIGLMLAPFVESILAGPA